MGKPTIPTLAEYIGDGARAPEYDKWLAEQIALMRRVDAFGSTYGTAWGKFVCALSVAFIEIGNQLHNEDVDIADVIDALPDAAGFAMMAAGASVLDDDCPPSLLAEVIQARIATGTDRFIASTHGDKAALNDGLTRDANPGDQP